MAKMHNTSKTDTTHTPENHGVTYEELQDIVRHRHSSFVIGDNDVA